MKADADGHKDDAAATKPTAKPKGKAKAKAKGKAKAKSKAKAKAAAASAIKGDDSSAVRTKAVGSDAVFDVYLNVG